MRQWCKNKFNSRLFGLDRGNSIKMENLYVFSCEKQGIICCFVTMICYNIKELLKALRQLTLHYKHVHHKLLRNASMYLEMLVFLCIYVN